MTDFPDFQPDSLKSYMNGPELWLGALPFPARDTHKYKRGHALIRGGSVMTGATRLAARAAQRIGAGLVTLASPSASYPIVAQSLESVMVRELAQTGDWQELLAEPKRNAVLIGPGLGFGAIETADILAALATGKPCVLDADALTAFAETPEILFKALHPGCLLTPHEGEFSRLFGQAIDAGLPKPDKARQAAKIAGCTVLLKGPLTVIASPGGALIVNDNAPPTLATGGSGDVLAGMALGLMAQTTMPGGTPLPLCAAAAAWLHGDIATRFGPGLIAEDLVEGLSLALKNLSELAGIV